MCVAQLASRNANNSLTIEGPVLSLAPRLARLLMGASTHQSCANVGTCVATRSRDRRASDAAQDPFASLLAWGSCAT